MIELALLKIPDQMIFVPYILSLWLCLRFVRRTEAMCKKRICAISCWVYVASPIRSVIQKIVARKASCDELLQSIEIDRLTFVLERSPFEPSIQTYSAMIDPFWSSFMYFSTLAVLETIVDSACRVGESAREFFVSL